MTVELILPAGAPEEEWQALRRSGLHGSEVAAAVGLSPFKRPFGLWLEKTGRVEPEFDDLSVERMRWGHLLEPLLLREFDERHPEWIMTGPAGVYAMADCPWMRGQPDGLLWTPDQRLAGLVECKSATHRQMRYWEDGQVPIGYVIQCQWYMHILGVPRTFVVALIDTSTYVERVLERDDELIADLVEQAAEFWLHVVMDTPPPVDASESTRRTLSRVRAHAGAQIELDPSWDKHIRQRDELTELLGLLGAERDLIDNELRAAMGDAETAYLDGRKLATHRAPGKPSRSCRWDELAADHPDIYRTYVTERPAGRRLTYTQSREDTP